MATSPIYNWPEPDNTDLVKNGALAMRTLGDAIDTTMATMTPKSIVDAKGDLIAASAADTPARLAVGANGETLVADSSTSTGLRYQGNFAAGKNKCLNSDYSIWQRGTSGFTNGSLTADRWYYYADGTGTKAVTQQTFTPGNAPVSGYEGKYFWRMTQSTAGTGGTLNITWQRIEDVQTFAGQTITVSFWAKADAARTISVGLNQNFGSGGSSAVALTGTNFSATTAWTRFSYTVAVPSIAGKTVGTSSYFEIQIGMPLNVVQTIDIWGVQAEIGSVATSFQTATGTIQGELAACQRYYQRVSGQSAAATDLCTGYLSSTTRACGVYVFPVVMRVAPTMGISAAADIQVTWSAGTSATSSYNTDRISPNSVLLALTTSGLTTGQGGNIFIASGTTKYLEASAEL